MRNYSAFEFLEWASNSRDSKPFEFLANDLANQSEILHSLLDVLSTRDLPPECERTAESSWTNYRQLSGLILKNLVNTCSTNLPNEVLPCLGTTALHLLQSDTPLPVLKSVAQLIVALTKKCGTDYWRSLQPSIDLPQVICAKVASEAFHVYPVIRYLLEDCHEQLGIQCRSLLFKLRDQIYLLDYKALEVLEAAFEAANDLFWPELRDEYSPFQRCVSEVSVGCASALSPILQDPRIPFLTRRSVLKLMTGILPFRDIISVSPEHAALWTLFAKAHAEYTAEDEFPFYIEACGFITQVAEHIQNFEEDPSQALHDPFFRALTPDIIKELIPTLLSRIPFLEDEVEELLEADSADIRDSMIDASGREDSQAHDSKFTIGEVESSTLRRQSLRTLEALTFANPPAAYSALFPTTLEKLFSIPLSDWLALETCIIILCSSLQGCYAFLRPSLPRVIDRLCELAVADLSPLLRCSACSALSCSIDYFLSDGQPQLPHLFSVLLQCASSQSKRLQRTALAALTHAILKLTHHNPSLLPSTNLCSAILTQLPPLVLHYPTNSLFHAFTLLETILQLYPSYTETQTTREILNALFQRIETAQHEFSRNPESLQVTEMLRTMGPLSRLLQSRLPLPDSHPLEPLLQTCYRCIFFHHSRNPQENPKNEISNKKEQRQVDTDYLTYPLRVASVVLRTRPGNS